MGTVVRVDWEKRKPMEASKTKKKGGKEKIYQLKITLAGSKPLIWRRVLVSEDITLRKLHKVIQTVMWWTDTHLHEFIIRGTSYVDPDPEMEMHDSENEKHFRLHQFAFKEKSSFKYIYDFGDDWEHKITVEKILDRDERYPGRPVCIAGRLSAPPEDCGGIFGYYDMLIILDDPTDPEYEEMTEWINPDFDPEELDLEDINAELRRIK